MLEVNVSSKGAKHHFFYFFFGLIYICRVFAQWGTQDTFKCQLWHSLRWIQGGLTRTSIDVNIRGLPLSKGCFTTSPVDFHRLVSHWIVWDLIPVAFSISFVLIPCVMNFSPHFLFLSHDSLFPFYFYLLFSLLDRMSHKPRHYYSSLTHLLIHPLTVLKQSIHQALWPVTCLTKFWFCQITILGSFDGNL